MSADNIQVAIKARPLLKKEKDKLSSQWRIVNNSIQLIDSQGDPFVFDHIFDEGSTNRQIFNTVAKPIVDATLRGFNGTIFAYGQTSSGKTYTMVGDDRNPGVMIMAVQEIFKEIEKATDRAFLLRVGYIEIYNEKIYDLLNKKNQDLKIHETGTGEVNVNCTDFIITCEQDMMDHLLTGNKTRKICETNMNERSSRSHAIFRIIIESRDFDKTSDETAVQISHLNLVDLAGSERADQTGATGSRLKEGCHINKSLLSLSCVINKLSENESDKYINYRDSKLTRILQASLGGNALTAIICTIKTTVTEETNSTLSFAMRAKSIKNKPHKNEVLSDAAMMKRLAKEISRLENELKVEKNKNSKIKIIQIEKQIKDAELKIVHSHSVGMDKNVLRRRTWCPSSNTLPPLVVNANHDILEDLVPSENTLIPPTPMFLTPLITIREQNNSPEEFIPGEEIEFSSGDFNHLDTAARTPLIYKGNNNVVLTPVGDLKTRYDTLSRDFEELQMFTRLEKETNNDLSDALSRIDQLEEERREYLKFLDDNHEKSMKLERSRERCLELESRILELNENINILESKEQSYQIKLKEYDQQVNLLLMASKDVEGLEYEYEKYKENTKFREHELLDIINYKQIQIISLEKQLQTVISTGQKIAYIDKNESNGSFVNEMEDNNSDNHPIPNTSTQLQDNKLNRSSESVISHVNVENFNLHSLQKEVIEKSELIKKLNTNIEEMQEQNSKLQKEYEELSSQVIDYVYENETLQSSLNDTKKIVEDLQKNVQIHEEKEVVLTMENLKLLENITELEKVLDQSETKNVSLKSEKEMLNVKLNRSLSDEPVNVHDLPEEVGDNHKFTKEHAVSIIEEILNNITEDPNSLQQFGNNFSYSCDFTEANRNVRLSLPNIGSLQSTECSRASSSEALIHDLIEQNKDISIKLRTIENVNKNLEDRINQLEKVRISLKSEIEDLNSNLARVENENKLLEEKVIHSEESNSNLELRLNCILNKFQISNKCKADNIIPSEQNQSEKLSLLDIEISNLLEKMDGIEIINRKLENRIKDFESKTVQSEQTEWNKTISQNEDYKLSLMKQINELKEKNDQVNVEKEDMEKQISKLKVDVNEQNDFIRNTKIELDKKESEIDQFKSETKEKSKQNHALETLLENLKEENNKINSELNNRNLEILKLQTNLDELEKNDLEKNAAVSQYKSSVQNLQSENKQIKENYNSLKVEMNELREINKKHIEEISTMKEEKLELSEKLRDIKVTVQELEKSNNEFKGNQDNLLLEISEKSNIKNNLEKDLETLMKTKAISEKETAEIKEKNIELNNELKESRTLLHNMEQECRSLKNSTRGIAESLQQLQEERDRLKEIKEELEKGFAKKLAEECEQTLAEMTNVRSKNLVLADQMETLEKEKKELEILLKLNVSRTVKLEKQHNSLNEKTKKNEEVLKSFETSNEELEEKLSAALNDYNNMAVEKEKLIGKILHTENALADVKNENVRLTKEKESIIALQKEQIEKATIKVDNMKVELEKKVKEHNFNKKENDEMKIQLSKKDSIIRDLHSQLETMLVKNARNNLKADSLPNKDCRSVGCHKETEIELLSLKEEHSQCLNTAKEKEELLKQLHEMQKMHVYKMKQYQLEIQELKQKIEQNHNQKISNTTEGEYYNKLLQPDNKKIDLNESERRKIIKTLIGENDELRIKNQDLTNELQESRRLSQKDRKSKRQSTHDEKRPLLWNESRDIGTMTAPTDKLCNCERLDKELSEVKKTLRIRDCQVNTLSMQSKYNPLKEKYETLKKSIEEQEADNKELRREIFKLKNQISAQYKQSKTCDKCLKRSKTVFVNQCSQTALLNEQSTSSNTTAKLENEHMKLHNKYEELKRLCRLRNTRIQDLENKLSKEKENETNNRQLANNTNVECPTDSLSKELYVLKKKYEEVKSICIYREKHIQTLEEELERMKCES